MAIATWRMRRFHAFAFHMYIRKSTPKLRFQTLRCLCRKQLNYHFSTRFSIAWLRTWLLRNFLIQCTQCVVIMMIVVVAALLLISEIFCHARLYFCIRIQSSTWASERRGAEQRKWNKNRRRIVYELWLCFLRKLRRGVPQAAFFLCVLLPLRQLQISPREHSEYIFHSDEWGGKNRAVEKRLWEWISISVKRFSRRENPARNPLFILSRPGKSFCCCFSLYWGWNWEVGMTKCVEWSWLGWYRHMETYI